MQRGDDGRLIAKTGYIGAQLRTMSDLRRTALPHFEVLEMEHVEHSSEHTPQDWIQLAEEMYRNYFEFDGFVVIHGVDTMHYTACAISFMLHNLSKPVVFTGAMSSLEESFNDARRNLVSAMMFAASPDISEVCIYFNNQLLRANRTVLVRRTLDAFESPNFPPLAVFGYEGFVLNSAVLARQPQGPVVLRSTLSEKVVTMVLTPNFEVAPMLDGLAPLSKKGDRRLCDALVLEVYGFGSLTSELAAGLVKIATRMNEVGALFVVTCPWLVRTTGLWDTKLKELDKTIVSVGDMTTECAVTKAMFVCGTEKDLNKARLLMCTPLRGELSGTAAQWGLAKPALQSQL